MKTTIWKWQVAITDYQTVDMPVGARLLDVQMQGYDCCIWAICDPDALREQRCIAMYGTGHPMPIDPGDYIATFQVDGGALVFHAFEVSCIAPSDTSSKRVAQTGN